MLRVTNDKIQKIMYIRDVIIPEARNDSKTDLDKIFHPCGTPSCLLGRAYQHGILKRVPGNSFETVSINVAVLGVSESEYGKIFGFTYANGGLYERSAACDRIIERMVAEVTP